MGALTLPQGQDDDDQINGRQYKQHWAADIDPFEHLISDKCDEREGGGGVCPVRTRQEGRDNGDVNEAVRREVIGIQGCRDRVGLLRQQPN